MKNPELNAPIPIAGEAVIGPRKELGGQAGTVQRRLSETALRRFAHQPHSQVEFITRTNHTVLSLFSPFASDSGQKLKIMPHPRLFNYLVPDVFKLYTTDPIETDQSIDDTLARLNKRLTKLRDSKAEPTVEQQQTELSLSDRIITAEQWLQSTEHDAQLLCADAEIDLDLGQAPQLEQQVRAVVAIGLEMNYYGWGETIGNRRQLMLNDDGDQTAIDLLDRQNAFNLAINQLNQPD